MITVISQMVLCLLVAAAIGAAVGWLLRHREAAANEQRLADLETELRTKGQALDTAVYELKVKTAAVMALESKVTSLESLGRSAQEDLASRHEQIEALQRELNESRAQQLSSRSEVQIQAARLGEQESALAAYQKEAREANAAHTKAQQELSAKAREYTDMQQRLVDAERRLEELDRLRSKLQELEPAQGRLHWLEVQLSEKEAQHRRVVHRLEEELAARDRRIAEESERSRRHEEREGYIAGLEGRLTELERLQAEIAGQAKIMGDQQEEISRLRKRLGEVRAALRSREDGGPVLVRPNGPANQLSLQIAAGKPSTEPRKDDLKKIEGISPAIERALNKMGTFTYVQIARWKPSDILRIAKKLDPRTGRIKPDHWIAGAKKQHREKYGEKL